MRTTFLYETTPHFPIRFSSPLHASMHHPANNIKGYTINLKVGKMRTMVAEKDVNATKEC